MIKRDFITKNYISLTNMNTDFPSQFCSRLLNIVCELLESFFPTNDIYVYLEFKLSFFISYISVKWGHSMSCSFLSIKDNFKSKVPVIYIPISLNLLSYLYINKKRLHDFTEFTIYG